VDRRTDTAQLVSAFSATSVGNLRKTEGRGRIYTILAEIPGVARDSR
jgi:hypothetical protein